MKSLVFAIVVAAVFTVPRALAHDNATLDAMPAPHGGQLRMAGPCHYELVAKANELSVYVTDHAGTAVPTRRATGTATVLSGAKKVSIPMQTASGNKVVGGGSFNLAPDTSVTVSLAFPGQSSQTAHFTPLRKAAPGARHAMH
jgi:hypothetical protein